MEFATPFALILLLALPFIWRTGWPRYAFRRRRDIASLLLRTAIIVCVVFALAGAQIVRDVEKLAVVFLVDASDSMGSAAQAEQLAFIRAAIADKPVDDEWAIIVYGANNRPEASFSTLTELGGIQSTVLTGNTNIAAALQTAIAIFPADATRRIVILSDGQETIGNAEAKARLAAASGIEISYVPYRRPDAPDVRVLSVDAPSRVPEGQDFDLSISIEADDATGGTLLIFSGGNLIQEQDVNLQTGITRFTMTQTSNTGGYLDFSARIVPADDDNYTQNNQLAAFTEIIGPPRVLLVSSDANTTRDEIAQLLPALQNAGVQVDIIAPERLPADVSGLADYKSVILVNVPATDLSTRQMQRLDTYVKDLGGGLVFIGGPDSYGPGRYYQTPLEDTLPVEMQIRDQQRLPQLTIAYLIDRSGSMGQTDASGIANIDLAKRAIDISIDLLQPTDRVAVGTFDIGGAWVAQFQPAENRRRLQELVGTLRSGGGTDIAAGLAMVERDIQNEPSERKHLILLTDGGANPRGLVQQTRRLYENYGVTTSVIALGSLQPQVLQDMVAVGNGNYHAVTDVSEIPKVFAQETVLAARTFIEEGDFRTRLTASSPIMDGIQFVPNLNGYVATTPKETAQVILRGPEPFSDPLLATWQYGLGRAVAFTSDATSRWATNWVSWDDFSRFWGQVVGWSITESAANNVETRIIMQDDRARVIVDARNDDGTFLNNLNLDASVLNPNNDAQPLRLQQVAPGRYEATFTPNQEGAYFVAVTGQGRLNTGDAVNFNEVNGWVMSYSREYMQTTSDETLLASLATLTGGSNLNATPETVFANTLEPRTAAVPIWPWLLVIALALLPFDIAVRRLIITRSDLQRLRAYLFRRRDDETETHVSSLRGIRDRARQRRETTTASDTVSRLRQRQTDTASSPSAPDGDDRTPAPRPQPRPQTPTPPRATSGDSSTVGSLLKRRRERDDE